MNDDVVLQHIFIFFFVFLVCFYVLNAGHP
jgi:hypothetical protein